MSDSTPIPTTVLAKGDIQAAINAGMELQMARYKVVERTIGDNLPVTVIPCGQKIVSLEFARGKPLRKRGTTVLRDIESFVRFVNEHKSKDTRIFARDGNFTAICDYHSSDAPAWGEFRAVFNSVVSEQWKIWIHLNGQWLVQKTFAEFIEENASDILNPPPAEMLEISATLEAKKDVNFKQAVRLHNGDATLVFEEVTQAKAGVRGELDVPKELTLNLSVFNGMPAQPVPCRLRYSIDDQKLAFKYEIIRLGQLLQDAALDLIEVVNGGCGIKCFNAETPGQVMGIIFT